MKVIREHCSLVAMPAVRGRSGSQRDVRDGTAWVSRACDHRRFALIDGIFFASYPLASALSLSRPPHLFMMIFAHIIRSNLCKHAATRWLRTSDPP